MAGKSKTKEDSLREHRTLNRGADRVTDELFLSDPFFDARDLVQTRYEMLRRVSQDGWTVSRSAGSFGVSRPTWYQSAKAFEEHGLAGLVPERPGPRRAHKLDGKVLEAILEARRTTPAITTDELVRLVRSRFDITVHRRSIERALGRAKKNRERRGASDLAAILERGL